MQDTSVSVLRPFHQAYNSANCQATVVVLGKYGMPLQLADIIVTAPSDSWCHVRSAEDELERFEVETGIQ